MKKTVVAALLSSLCLCVFAAPGDPPRRCRNDNLKGLFVFSTSGMQRPGGPGTPWVPKAILEVLQFGGDGIVTTPLITIANPPPFDLGNYFPLDEAWPIGGSSGQYTLNEDCSGTVQFNDAGNVRFRIYVDRTPRPAKIWMIQTNPLNNVFQGVAERID